MAKTSILVLTKNEARNIGFCLEAVYSQRAADAFEVVVVDSGSTDATLEIVRNFPARIVQIPAETFHHAGTRNLAASLAEGEILVFLVADAIPASDTWLDALTANFDDPEVGAVYGRQLPKPGASLEREDALNALYGEQRMVKDPAHRNGLGYRFYHFSDVNAAIRRSVWQAARFPEEMKVFEDMGIAKRILDLGWKIIYEPTSPVLHSHNHSTVGLFKRYFDLGYTMKLLNIWEGPGSRKSLVRDVWRLLKRKAGRLNGKGTGRLAGEGIRQDVVKSIGFFLGLNQNLLPLALKRRLSAFRVFG
jgi:glycosyltransferase involved in cell wall biosynthesis